jgi:hypothetical protein
MFTAGIEADSFPAFPRTSICFERADLNFIWHGWTATKEELAEVLEDSGTGDRESSFVFRPIASHPTVPGCLCRKGRFTSQCDCLVEYNGYLKDS